MTGVHVSSEAAPSRGRFSLVPLATTEDGRISDRTYRVLNVLLAYADREGKCWPSQAKIAAHLGVSRQAIGQHVMALRKLGYVTLERRVRQRGGWASNRYVLHNPPLVNGAPHAEAVQGQVLQR
ncbi:MAG: helix-turn-helix domain-containing protein [Rhodospirillales bacterium]|nr:helix-turn-helix domain-containing protein [Rhodospirillales bacterium]